MTLRKILFWSHLTAGCLAGLVILIMSITGVLLAYERQVIAWMDRDLRADPRATSAKPALSKILAAAAQQKHATPASVTLRADASAPLEVSFARDHVFLVDPYSGKLLGESATGARAFFQQVENWHRWLGASGDNRSAGRAFTGASNFAFLLIVLSGPFLWMPRRWSWRSVRAIMLFRKDVSGRARDFNWHNVIGIWCAIPLAVIVASGVVMSYPWANNLLYRITGSEVPAAGGGRPGGDARQGARSGRSGQQAGPNLKELDALWQRAEHQVPAWQSIALRLPPANRGPFQFTIDTGTGGRPDQRAQLTLDRSGAVVRWEPFASYNTGRRLRSWLRFLHTGEAGGVPGETLATVVTAGAVVLVWTGISLALRRFLRRPKRAPIAQPAGQDSVVTTV
jgi:uncharacterized iron-regulated membrane protein